MEGTSVKIITLLILICARVYALHYMQTSPLCMLQSPTLCSPFHPDLRSAVYSEVIVTQYRGFLKKGFAY